MEIYQKATPTRSPPPAAIRMMERLVEIIPAAERPMETTPMNEGGNLAMMAWNAPYQNNFHSFYSTGDWILLSINNLQIWSRSY